MPTAVLCVSTTGSNGNSGLTWDAPKKDVLGAYDALPSTGGTILFEDLCYVDSANTDRGLWLAGPNDSQYGAVPTGWRVEKPLLLEGVPSIGAAGSRRPGAKLRGGSTTDLAKPLFWFSGTNKPQELRNLATAADLARPMILGSDSGTGVATNNSSFVLDNVLLSVNQAAGKGPAVYDNGSYWIYVRDCTFYGNNVELYTADLRACWLMVGGTQGEGIKFLSDSNFNGGGGFKSTASVGHGNIVIENIVQEGGTNPSAPIYWLSTAPSAPDGSVVVRTSEQADYAGGSDVAVRVAALNDPGTVIVEGISGNGIAGPMTISGTSGGVLTVYSDSPTANRAVGFAKGRVHGQHDSARRSFGPVAARFTNRADQDTANWSAKTGTATVTTGKTAPDGTTQAAELSGGNLFRRVTAFGVTPALGDWIISGVWMRSVSGAWPTNSPQHHFSNTSYKMDSSAAGSSFAVLNPPFRANAKEWQWVSRPNKVTVLDAGATTLNFDLYCDTAKAIEYHAPNTYYIPASVGWTDAEVLEFAAHMAPSPSAVLPGDAGLLKGQALSFNGVRIVRCTGTPEAAVTAPVGSLALRDDGGAATTLYVKQTGTGNTGWTAVTP